MKAQGQAPAPKGLAEGEKFWVCRVAGLAVGSKGWLGRGLAVDVLARAAAEHFARTAPES